MIEPLQELGRKMRDLAQALGCDLDAFVVMPDLEGDNNLVQVVFVLPPAGLQVVDIDREAASLLADIDAWEQAQRDDDTRAA